MDFIDSMYFILLTSLLLIYLKHHYYIHLFFLVCQYPTEPILNFLAIYYKFIDFLKTTLTRDSLFNESHDNCFHI